MPDLFLMLMFLLFGLFCVALSIFGSDNKEPWGLLAVIGTVFVMVSFSIGKGIANEPNKIRCEMLKGQFLEGECYKATKIKLPEDSK